MSVAVFLQGPHGPFFAKLAKRLSQQGVITHKINFNAGDRYFSWADFLVDFTGSESDWSSFLRAYLLENGAETVFIYGDCRRYHSKARSVCESLGIAFAVFEEGYLRPDFVTLEWGGVNAFSQTDWSLEAINGYEPAGANLLSQLGKPFGAGLAMRWDIMGQCACPILNSLCTSTIVIAAGSQKLLVG